MIKCLYYPGCSQKGTSLCYEKSFLAICPLLGIEITELDDWNCCGTTAAISLNKLLSTSLTARNLALAESADLPVVTPCPSCYLSFKRVNNIFQDDISYAEKVNGVLSEDDLKYLGKVKVYHLLEFLIEEVGLEKIKEKVRVPLRGLKVAPYYGCQISRPYGSGDDIYNPQNMEKLIEALGAEVVDFPHRTQCCGGALMLTQKKIAVAMSRKILDSIKKTDADLIVTPCGLCQFNLQTAQSGGKKTPVLNIAQLLGIAFDLDKKDIQFDKKPITNAGVKNPLTADRLSA